MRQWALLMIVAVLLVAGQPAPVAAETGQSLARLGPVKDYLVNKAFTLRTQTDALKRASTQYYYLAAAMNFDYQRLWNEQPDLVRAALTDGRRAWIAASPLYEQMEGIVAGVASLAEYDVILDSGTSAADGGDHVVPFDIPLPDGRVLVKPGNLFGVTESTLWGTYAEYTVPNVWPDLNGDGVRNFGEAFPDANVLYSSASVLDLYSGGLQGAADGWQPTEADAFTALVVMVPTMTEYFESWKASRFVAGSGSTQRDFVVISRLSDIIDIVSGLQIVYTGLQPEVTAVSPSDDHTITEGLDGLKQFVASVYSQEQAGRHFTAEEADSLGAEAQHRATTLTGQIVQVAARLGLSLQVQ